MNTGKSSMDLQAIARAGGSLEIEGGHFSSMDLQAIARPGNKHGARLEVVGCGHLSSMDMQAISRASKGNVTFR